MRLIYQLVNNYGVAIVLFTIITKILLFPISYKQQKNTLRMQLIQPKLKKLQAKYKDKPQELQQAQMQLYQEEHVNPMSSCLPMFLQFFLLFGVLDVVYKPLTHILHYSKSVISKVVEISTGILGDSVAKQYTGLRQELGVLKAFQDNKVSDVHFNSTTGYGYDDAGRETIDKIYAQVFGAEDALVRHNIINGTHAISLCLFAVLRPGDTLVTHSRR